VQFLPQRSKNANALTLPLFRTFKSTCHATEGQVFSIPPTPWCNSP